MIQIVTSQATPQMEDFFSLDGVVYQIPVEIPGSVALGFLDKARREGELPATGWAVETVLGTPAYRALLACKSLSGTDLKAIMNVVMEKITGMLEETGK